MARWGQRRNERDQFEVGAIGKREVYRDGQVASADVGTPGAAPVAVKAVLESGEFKALAKNPAFQEMIKSDTFAQLSINAAFVGLLADASFRSLAQTQAFAAQEILNRGWGRPATAITGEGDTGPAKVELTVVNEFHP